MMEFLDHCLEDVSYFSGAGDKHASLEENFTVLRNYLEFLTKGQIYDNNLEKVLIAVENLAYEMARNYFVVVIGEWTSLTNYNEDKFFSQDIHSVFRFAVLEALVVQPDDFSSTTLMSDDLVNGYVKCVQDNLLELQKNKTIDLTDTWKGQFMILREEILFLKHLLITYPSKHNSNQKKISDIRLHFQTLARDVGSVICSCVNSPKIDEMSLDLFRLIEKADVIEGKIIKNICCMVLQDTQQESSKNDNLGSLILLLQILKDFMDHKPSLVITWKEHENLVLFIFYLIQNNIRDGNCIDDDKFSRRILQLDIALINPEELNRVLVSAQVIAFNMACSSLLMRYGKLRNLCWWELYLGTEEHVDMHMTVGTLKAIVLSSTTPLADELLNAYGKSVQNSFIELLRGEAFDPLKDQFQIIQEGFSFLVRLPISCGEHEKISHIKVDFQYLVRGVGSVICSHFNNRVNGDMMRKDNARELSNLLEKMNLVKAETQEILPLLILSLIGRESPKTNPQGSLNLLLENWKGMMECESDLLITWKDEFQMIQDNLVLFKSFITGSNTGDDESQSLCSSIVDAGHVAEYLLTTFAVGTCPVWGSNIWIDEFMEQVELIKLAVLELKEKNRYLKEICIAENDQSGVSSPASQVPTLNDVVVGFEVELDLIRKQLYARLKQLDVISIVGMPGLGKTTLARKIYEDSSAISYFDARAWCTVSQEYNKREMLLAILGSLIQLKDEIRNQRESELSVMIHKQLKGRRYFIVLDDIWDIKAFLYIKCFFPDDNNGSRVMLTSRSKEIGSPHGNLIEPGLLTDEQSWELLAQKVYNKEKCPYELCQIGKDIAKKCRGLPLGIVVVGGVLANGPDQKQDFWEQVLENLSLYLARDPQSQFMAALELSYAYLPDCLKPMFLYLGAFPEDAEIPTTKLMRLWSAEGSLQNTESTSLESRAEKSLMDLIDRSLVMVAKRRWDGKVKACHVHDLLRDMCLTKAKNEKFMQQIHVHSEFPDTIMFQQRLSIFFKGNDETTSRHLAAYKDLQKFAINPSIYSLLFYIGQTDYLKDRDLMPVISSLKLLKVFDSGYFEITQDILDKDLIMLVHLRYVSCRVGRFESMPLSISRLRSLETLIIECGSYYDGSRCVDVPETIWEMTKLRHLHIGGSAKFSAAPENSFILDNLQTLSEFRIDAEGDEKILKKVPNLKKLSCSCYKPYDQYDQYPNFESLGKLESLRLWGRSGFRGQLKLPLTLRKLNISSFHMEWSEISIFQSLPNLEVLKLGHQTVEGECWDMGDDDVFSNLKYLRLDQLNVKRWSASSVNFPQLEKLVLYACSNLEEIPSDLGEFVTLREIWMFYMSSSLIELVKEIKQEQEDFGIDSFKLYFDNNGWDQ